MCSKSDPGQSIELMIALTLSTRDKIRYLEIIKNGRSEIEANLDDFQASGGKLPPIKFDASGWFLVRAITDNNKTYRYATTAPYYVEVGYQPRISRGSVQFFLDWTNKRATEIQQAVEERRFAGVSIRAAFHGASTNVLEGAAGKSERRSEFSGRRAY